MIENLFRSKRLILASASPRRNELLRSLGVPFERLEVEYSEPIPKSGSPGEIAVSLALSKADEIRHLVKPDDIFITADTIVWCENRILNKPGDRDEAFEMLRFLSGKTHMVLTGVCLLSNTSVTSFFSETLVTFRELKDLEIEYYIDNFNPYDKAGSYGIQEWIGYIGVEFIEGSYYNVMGLPVQKLYTELINFLNNNITE